MTCSHCVAAVSSEVAAVAGVTDVAVDLDSGRLRVTSDRPLSVQAVVDAVAGAGYAVVTDALAGDAAAADRPR